MALRISLSGKKGPFVGPWEIFADQSRVLTMYGMVNSSLSMNASESMPCLAENLVGEILYLGLQNSEPIKLLINSPGGSVAAGFQIIQAIEHVQARGIEVWTVAQGMTASMASVILVCGTPGRRYTFPRSDHHFHAETATVTGKGIERDHANAYNDRLRENLYGLMLDHTKLSEFHAQETEDGSELTPKRRLHLLREFLQGEPVLSAEQALRAGVVDVILSPGDSRIDDIFALARKNANPEGSK